MIGIDFTSAARERAGIGRYARELVRALARIDRTNRYALFVPRDAHADLLAGPSGVGSQMHAAGGHPGWPSNFSISHAPLSERWLAALWHRANVPLPVEAFIGPVDVFYSPDFLLPPTRARKAVVTVHDLSYVRVPECFPDVLRNYLNKSVPRAVRRADLILADAQSTQRDLVEVYGVPLDKTRVVYSGVDDRFCPAVDDQDQARVRDKYNLRRPYILSVSTIQPRKNYVRLIQAFAGLISSPESPAGDLQLVIAGGKGWMYDEVYETVRRLGLDDRVVFPGFVADDDLPALYAMATLFVYPSLYEGFGLGVAEAMASGVPVVCSNASSLPEVAGKAALYFDPLNVDEMAMAIRRALGSEPLRKELRAKGLAQVKQFSWDRAAEQLLGYLIHQMPNSRR